MNRSKLLSSLPADIEQMIDEYRLNDLEQLKNLFSKAKSIYSNTPSSVMYSKSHFLFLL